MERMEKLTSSLDNEGILIEVSWHATKMILIDAVPLAHEWDLGKIGLLLCERGGGNSGCLYLPLEAAVSVLARSRVLAVRMRSKTCSGSSISSSTGMPKPRYQGLKPG